MRLNPRYPPRYLKLLGRAYRMAGRYEEAIAHFEESSHPHPNFGPAHLNLAVCYTELGRLEEARAEVAETLRINPQFSLESVEAECTYKDPADIERILAALRKAGLK